jgi:hypothetical protein
MSKRRLDSVGSSQNILLITSDFLLITSRPSVNSAITEGATLELSSDLTAMDHKRRRHLIDSKMWAEVEYRCFQPDSVTVTLPLIAASSGTQGQRT